MDQQLIHDVPMASMVIVMMMMMGSERLWALGQKGAVCSAFTYLH